MKNLTPAKMILLVVLAFGGMIGLFVVKRLMAVEPPPKKALVRNIPLALGDLPPGTVIKQEHIGTGPWPTDDVKGDVLLSPSGIVGRVVKEGIKAASPVHGKSLFAFGELPPLKVSEGYQAVTIKSLDNSHILNGLIKPGDHVDIKFTLKEMLSDPRVVKLGGITMTLFKGVQVLALNRDFVQAPLSAAQNSVTLEVPEKDANLLLLAAAKGELALTYTPKRDGKAVVAMDDSERATLEELLRLEPLPTPPAPTKLDPPVVTDIYRRSGRQTSYFRDGYPTHTAYPSGYNANGYPSGYNGPGSSSSVPAWNYSDPSNDNNPNLPGGAGYGPGRGANQAPGIPSTMNAPGYGDPYGAGPYGGGGYGAPGGSWNPAMANPPPANTSSIPARERVSSRANTQRR